MDDHDLISFLTALITLQNMDSYWYKKCCQSCASSVQIYFYPGKYMLRLIEIESCFLKAIQVL